NSKDNSKFRNKVVATFLKSPEYQGKHAAAATQPAAPKVPGPDTTRNPRNVIFNKTGVFVNDASAMPIGLYKNRLKMANVAWIAIQIDNGGNVRTDNTGAIEK